MHSNSKDDLKEGMIHMSVEELAQYEKQARQESHLRELEYLTSDKCPKRHPFDFRPGDLADIKKIFPEFKQQKQSGQAHRMASNTQGGVPITELREHFLQVMGLDPSTNKEEMDLIDTLMEKLDHKNSDKITWSEFLKFLDHEGLKREMVNDAQLYGIGVKRMKEKQRINLKQTPNQIEYYIDCCAYISFTNNFKFLLAMFENNTAKIFDAKTFKVVQELHFPSSYGQPKPIRPTSQYGSGKRKLVSEKKDMGTSSLSLPKPIGAAAQRDSTSTSTGPANPQQKPRKPANPARNSDPATAGVSSTTGRPQAGISLTSTSAALPFREAIIEENDSASSAQRDERVTNQRQSKSTTGARQIVPRTQSQQSRKETGYIGRKASRPGGSLGPQRKQGVSASSRSFTAQQSQPALLGSVNPGRARDLTSKQKQNLDIIREQAKSALRPQSQFNSTDPYNIIKNASDSRRQTADEIKRESLIALKNKINQRYGRKLTSKPQKQMYVLGLDSLIDEEGSTAFFASKDLEKETGGFGVRALLPDLYSTYGKSKDEFETYFKEKERGFKATDKYIKHMETHWEQTGQVVGGLRNSDSRELNKDSSLESLQTQGQILPQKYTGIAQKQRVSRFKKPSDENEIREQMKTFLSRKNEVDEKIDVSKAKMDKLEATLMSLKETNRYFYRLTSPSPYMVAQQLYIKRLLERRGVDTTNQIEVTQHLARMNINSDPQMVRNITGNVGPPTDEQGEDGTPVPENTNYCTPEMIARYVEKLRAEKRDTDRPLFTKSKASHEHPNQKKQVTSMQTKAVYTLCATYSEELNILALSLIDKEIKVYRVKQNGAKINFLEHISFHAKYIITCICVELCASTSRPILCMGSKSGDIQIYYLDEPFIDPVTKKPILDGNVREKQHDRSPFNFFKSHQCGPSASAAANKSQVGQKDEVIEVNHDSPILEEESQSVSDNGMPSNQKQPPPRPRATNGSNAQLQEQMTWPFGQDKHAPKEQYQAESKAGEKDPKQKGNKYKAVEKQENEITCIRYVRDIGLICSTFNGTVKFFDAFSFNEQWCSMNKQRKEHQHTNITVFDVSVKLGLMATGGAEGRLILIDPYALGIINGVEAHQSEILQVYIFDEQQQIITVAIDRSIGLWDASRLEKIEIIRDVGEGIRTPKFSSSSFDYQRGQLFVGCQQISVWEAQTDQKVEINALQVQTLSKDVLKQRKMLDSQDPSYSQEAKDANKKGRDTDAKTGKVLVTSASTLVEIVLNQQDTSHFLITIDSENLLRCWNTEKSLTTLSYRLPVQSRVTAAAVDETNKFLAVGTSSGESKVINLKSGGVLYNLAHCGSEVTYLKFIDGMTEFWLFGACWGGKLMMWTKPAEDNNFTISARCRVGHKSDVLSLDCSQNFIVSGGVDGIVSVWNVFSGQLKYAINMPSHESRKAGDAGESGSHRGSSRGSQSASSSDGDNKKKLGENDKKASYNMKRSVVGICFHPYYQNHACILQEGGDIHLVDATNGVISHKNVAKAKMNSSWACDPVEMKMFVIGDVGRARLYDISMEADVLDQRAKMRSNATNGGKKKKLQSRYTSPPKYSRGGHGSDSRSKGKHQGSMAPMRWPVLVDFFKAHKIPKREPSYVVSAKFVDIARVYVTGTTNGQVKLWDNQECRCLGTLNSIDWNPRDVLDHIANSKEASQLIDVENTYIGGGCKNSDKGRLQKPPPINQQRINPYGKR